MDSTISLALTRTKGFWIMREGGGGLEGGQESFLPPLRRDDGNLEDEK